MGELGLGRELGMVGGELGRGKRQWGCRWVGGFKVVDNKLYRLWCCGESQCLSQHLAVTEVGHVNSLARDN